jgi:LuxR family maltose regulon positive regulatory protein
LTLVVAPAGFGKTTLIGDWLRREGEARPAAGATRTAWLALDERDNDPVLFWSYVIAALQTIAPGVGAGALLILGRRSAPSPPLDQILTLLLNDLAALLDDPAAPDLALILDDYHVITAPPIHDALAFLLDRIPPRLRLVITSRHDPPLPLARLRVRGQLLELRAADLRFTSAEAAAFLNDVMSLDLTSRHWSTAPRAGSPASNSPRSRCRNRRTAPGSSVRSAAATATSWTT